MEPSFGSTQVGRSIATLYAQVQNGNREFAQPDEKQNDPHSQSCQPFVRKIADLCARQLDHRFIQGWMNFFRPIVSRIRSMAENSQ